MQNNHPLRGLYAITPEHPRETMRSQVEAALAGGARLLQYRRKSTPQAQRADEAASLLTLCRRYGVPLIVNDDAALASLIGADGVHLGRDDGDAAAARRLLGPRAIIGVSCYDRFDLACDAVRAGADYVAFGSVFATGRKPDAARATPALLTRAAAELPVPVCAIGGIDRHNAADVLATGVLMLAVIGDLFDHDATGAAAAAFAALFDSRPASRAD